MHSKSLMGPKKFYLETYGCQMNEYDTLLAQKILESAQGERVQSPNEAEFILLNTCAIRENAHDKIYQRLNHLGPIQRKGARIAILGCMAQNLKEELMERDLPVNYLVGPDSLRSLANLMHDLPETDELYLDLSRTETYTDIVPEPGQHQQAGTAFISIQRGCDNFCSFCVVPYTRGRERSRDPESIIEEIQSLANSDFHSVVLLGQNVNSYKFEKTDFAALLNKIVSNTSIKRIYFTSPHPKDFPSEVLDIIATEPRLATQVHLPLQSGSSKLLQSMRRSYSKEEFLNIGKNIRKNIPDVSITTDIIVGFPGETDEDFQQTMEVMEEMDFDHAFMFAYSHRKGTGAARKLEDNVPAPVKKQRLAKCIEAQQYRSHKLNQKYIETVQPVLIEGHSKRDEKELKGRLRNGKKVVLSGYENLEKNDFVGKETLVRIKSATSVTLLGHVETI
jgi:tRNA-2-methylthio-N6-dimethylallyladenosine synthase